MMYSAYKLNKQGDSIQPWHTPFPIWNQSVFPCPVLTVASWPAYRFLKRWVRWSGIPISFRISTVYCDPHSQGLINLLEQSYHIQHIASTTGITTWWSLEYTVILQNSTNFCSQQTSNANGDMMGTTTPKSLKVALIFVMSPVILFVIDSLGCVCVGDVIGLHIQTKF